MKMFYNVVYITVKDLFEYRFRFRIHLQVYKLYGPLRSHRSRWWPREWAPGVSPGGTAAATWSCGCGLNESTSIYSHMGDLCHIYVISIYLYIYTYIYICIYNNVWMYNNSLVFISIIIIMIIINVTINI